MINMDFKDCINIIKNCTILGCAYHDDKDKCKYDYYEKAKRFYYAKEQSIKALEKQVPKKPIYSEFDDNGYDEIIPYKAECPTCGYEFEFGTWNDEENHHCICGQKIDWIN